MNHLTLINKLSVLLIFAICFVLTTFAYQPTFASDEVTEITEGGNYSIDVSYTKSSIYMVTLPKFVVVKEDGSEVTTKLSGTLDNGVKVIVEPVVEDNKLYDMTGVKNPIAYTMFTGKTEFSNTIDGVDALKEGVVATHRLVVDDIRAGNWTGNMTWRIRVVDE